MNMKLNILMLAMCSLVLSGCGLLGKKGVTEEQINNDIANRSVKVKDGSDWNFKFDYERYFSINDNESKMTTSNADISVTVAAWKDLRMPIGPKLYLTLFGKMMLHYKNEGGKWVLESIEPKDLIKKDITHEELPKFLDIVMPQCKDFRYASWHK